MSKRRFQALMTFALVLSDAGMTGLAYYLAYQLRRMTESRPEVILPDFSVYAGMMAIQVAIIPVVFFFSKLYHVKRASSRVDEFYSIFGAVSVGTLMAVAVTAFVYKGELDYPRLMVIYAWVLTIVLVTLGRWLHDVLRSFLRRRGFGRDRVLIVGADDVGRMLLQKMRYAPKLGYEAVGFVDGGQAEGDVMGVPIVGTIEELPRIIDEYEVDEVLIGMPDAPRTQLLDIIAKCDRGRIGIKVFPDVFQIMASELGIGDLNGLPMLTVRDVALRGWRLTLKRAFDVIVASILLVLLSPFMLLIALLVKLDSPGPALYIQERMGMDAKPFPMIKFRTMHVDAEKETGAVWAKPGDPRRTRVGALLRRYSLDELPQLVNVILGDMSLVGPRPERPVFVEQFRRRIPRYMERHREKAGMTGWAQVNGLRGDTSIEERTKYDLWYVENWSLLLDIKILIRTLFRLLHDPHAY